MSHFFLQIEYPPEPFYDYYLNKRAYLSFHSFVIIDVVIVVIYREKYRDKYGTLLAYKHVTESGKYEGFIDPYSATQSPHQRLCHFTP